MCSVYNRHYSDILYRPDILHAETCRKGHTALPVFVICLVYEGADYLVVYFSINAFGTIVSQGI